MSVPLVAYCCKLVCCCTGECFTIAEYTLCDDEYESVGCNDVLDTEIRCTRVDVT